MSQSFNNPLLQRHIISAADLSLDEIDLILISAETMKQRPMPEYLKGKILASCFFEPSTRTRLSFESSMMRLGGQVIGFSDPSNTSSKKQESLSDSIKIISQYADAIVLRHPAEGAARLAAQVSQTPVINAGDGANRHPSQTLLDLFTIKECQGRLDHLSIAFVGDLKYGRTVHSLLQACSRYPGNRFYFVSPEMLSLPEHVNDILRSHGVKFSFHRDIKEIINRVDILYMTRMQRERFEAHEFKMLQMRYQLNASLLTSAKQTMKILHPLPRVDEINIDVDQMPQAHYFHQAENGLYVRQALLALLLSPQKID